jgi:hypothetical protein
MDAGQKGFGLVVPMPRSADDYLGKVVYIDEGGVVRSVGRIFDDVYFQSLADQQTVSLDRTTSDEQQNPSLVAAFATGCMEIAPMTKEELSA